MHLIPRRLAVAVANTVVIVATASGRLDAQDSASIAAFEVASIKPRTGERAGPAA